LNHRPLSPLSHLAIGCMLIIFPFRSCLMRAGTRCSGGYARERLHTSSPFGNPAACHLVAGPKALRPRLAAGLPLSRRRSARAWTVEYNLCAGEASPEKGVSAAASKARAGVNRCELLRTPSRNGLKRVRAMLRARIRPVHGGQNGPKSTVSVACRATLQAHLRLFRPFQHEVRRMRLSRSSVNKAM
jgi:hypothetical protein